MNVQGSLRAIPRPSWSHPGAILGPAWGSKKRAQTWEGCQNSHLHALEAIIGASAEASSRSEQVQNGSCASSAFRASPATPKRPSRDSLKAILGPSWGHLGPILGPSWGPKSHLEALKTIRGRPARGSPRSSHLKSVKTLKNAKVLCENHFFAPEPPEKPGKPACE